MAPGSVVVFLAAESRASFGRPGISAFPSLGLAYQTLGLADQVVAISHKVVFWNKFFDTTLCCPELGEFLSDGPQSDEPRVPGDRYPVWNTNLRPGRATLPIFAASLLGETSPARLVGAAIRPPGLSGPGLASHRRSALSGGRASVHSCWSLAINLEVPLPTTCASMTHLFVFVSGFIL
jgi:hypothetical protein